MFIFFTGKMLKHVYTEKVFSAIIVVYYVHKECIGYENGVLGGVVCALNILCSRGDKVLLHSPTYIGFTMSLSNNGYDIVHSPLVKDDDGIYRMDFEDMEKAMSGWTSFDR